MATEVKEQTAFDAFLSKLDSEKAREVRAALNNPTSEREDFLTRHIGDNLKGLDLGGRTTDDVLNAAGKMWDERFPEKTPTETLQRGQVKGAAWTDVLHREEHHSGGGGEADPQMHTFIKEKQQAELLEEFKKIAQANPDEREALLTRFVDEKFESKELLETYHKKLLSYLQSLPSFQKLTEPQRKQLTDRLNEQHNTLQTDILEQEAKEVTAVRDARKVARKAEIKLQLQELLKDGFDEKKHDAFTHIVEEQQRPFDSTLRSRYSLYGKESLWGWEAFYPVYQQMHFLPQMELFGYRVSTPRVSISIPPPPEPFDEGGGSSQRGGARRKNKKKKKNHGPLGNLLGRGKNALKNAAKQTLEKAAKKVAEEVAKWGLKAAFTSPPYIGEIVVGVLLLFAIIAGVFVFLLGGVAKQQQDQQQQITPAVCVDADSIQAATDPSLLSQTFQNKYHITLFAKDSATLTLPLMQSLYTDSCISFGQIKAGGVGANNLDTLGKYVTGYSVGGLAIQINLVTDSTQNDCTSTYIGQNSKTITWQLTNFDLCNDGRQRFLVGKTFANIFTQQQNYLRVKSGQSRQTLLDEFRQSVEGTSKLPTKDCYTGGGDTQVLGCFTDMAGEYLSFPYYLYQSPNYTPPSDEKNFMNYPTDYSTYYYFAQHNLFDDLDFFHVGHPKPPYTPTDYAAAIKKEFNITMVGLPQQELQWAWEKFWDVSNTNYMKLLKNSRATVYNSTGTAYMFCNLAQGCIVHLHEFGDQMGFDVVLLHELAHVIDYSNPLPINHKVELMAAVIADRPTFDGWMTKYSQLLCLYPPGMPLYAHLGEDYAEMLTYYVNPQANMLTACGWGDNPYANGLHAAHKKLAQEILGVY